MKSISVSELKKLMDSKQAINLLDVREADERAAFNIGGKHISLGSIMHFETDEIENLKNEDLYIYCRSGKRSMQAAMVLEQMGFAKTFNIEGGTIAWILAFGTSAYHDFSK